MIAEELINQLIPPLKPSDPADKALSWMEKLRITQLPVVDEKEYKGVITEDLIYDHLDSDKVVGDFQLIASAVSALPNSHFYDVIKLAIENGLQLVPVLDVDRNFLGVISVNETAATLAKMFAAQGPGGIIVISLAPKDYSMSEIARLIEANDTRILSAFFLQEHDSDQAKLTLKLNREDLTRIIATLERHSYSVVAHFQETELLNVDKERLDMLLRYLNM